MLRSKAAAVLTAGFIVSCSGLALAADTPEEFSAQFGGRTVKATVPSGWKKLNAADGAPGSKLLGYWSGHFTDLYGDLTIRGLEKAPKSIDDLANKLPAASRIFPEGCEFVRQWSVYEGDGTHIQLMKERHSNPQDESGYWLRYLRVEKVGDKVSVMALYLRLKEHPGSHEEFARKRQLIPHLKIAASFKVSDS